jgi:hypothetical protein
MVTFVAVENPAAVLGVKRREVVSTRNQPHSIPAPYAEAGKLGVDKKIDFYADRFARLANSKADWAPKGLSSDLLKDAAGNQATVMKLFEKTKADPNTRVLMCGSVNSMAKYILNYCQQNVGTQIDTLVIYGHGGSSSINVGLGRIGGLGAADLREAEENEDDEEADNIRRGRALTGQPGRIREMSVDNKDLWGAAFASLQPHVARRADSACFHLFLMACSVGDEVGKPRQSKLVKVAAKELRARLGITVVVAAPTQSIGSDDLFKLLKQLPQICEATAAGEATLLGTIPLAVGSA